MTDPTPQTTTPTRDEAVQSPLDIAMDALFDVRRAIFNADPAVLTDTLWMPEDTYKGGTVVDFIENAMERVRSLASAPAPASGMDAVLNLYREAVRIDVKMEGPQFMGANSSALKRAWEADRASLSPAATPVSEAGGELHHASGERITRKDLNDAYRKGAEDGRLATKLIDGMRPAALSKPASSPADAVIWQTRMRPIWDLASPWSPWTGSTKAHAEACAAKPISGDWEIEARALVPASLSPSEAEPVAWQSMETAPRDGTWFEARTESGYRRRVHFARDDDRLPIDHSNEMWSTVPVEWRPLAVPDAVKTLETRIAKLMAELQNSATAEGQWHNRAQSAETALKAIAEHPEQSDDGARSYKVGWAFWNVQNIAKAALSQSASAGRVGE